MASQSAQLTAKVRGELGSRRNKRLRDAGFVPGVIYGHKEAVVPVTVPKKELVGHLNHGAHLFNLALDGKSENVLVKDVQYDHLGIEVLHVDFTRVDLHERVEVTVPLILKGEPKGEAEGGVLTQVISDIQIECLVTQIPEDIRHNVSDMGLNDVVHIADLKLPDGVRAIQDPDQIVATVKEVVEEAPAEVAEGAAEPEVIGKVEEGAEGAAPAEDGAAKE
jgi:large subunit ribosomal protein L25